MSSGIDCGKLEEVLESIFQIPVDAAKLDKWVNGGEFETVILGGKEVPTLRNLVRQIDERSSQAAEEEINEAKKEIGTLAEKLKAKIEELKALTASAETLPPDHPATAYYNSGTGEIEFGIPQGKQGIQGERGLAPAIDIIYGGDPSDEALSIIYGGNPALDEPGDRTIIRQVARIGTSAQWATANPILEDGESGYERTPEDKLLWKTGDGVTCWNDLPYPSILVDKIYRYRGSVATVEDLPTDAAEGDVYNITSTGANYAWTGTEWDNLGVAGAIDPVPVKDSGNPVASGGVYAALENMQTDIAATGAPDDVTIIKDESGKLVAQDIAIGGDPTDLASARGVFNSFGTGSIDFNTLTKQGMYSVPIVGSVNGPGFACRMRVQSTNGNIVTQVAVGDRRAKYRTLDSTGVWSTWREIVLADRIGDGIRVTDGILSVPEYEGATATEPGTAGLVNPAASAEKDYVYHGDGTWRENTNVKVDGTTIAKDGSDVISVIPGGIIDNDTIVLDASGKISTKSVPFDKPSDNRWRQSHFIFSAVANTAVPVNATNLVNYDTSANNSVLFEPNSSGQLICRKTGLYGVRVEFSTYYVGDGSTAMDGWFYIKLNNIDIGSSGTPLLAAANEPNVFTCYVNRRIEAGQIISTAWNIPYTGNVQVNYIDYQFTYFPVTNEYQVSNAEYRGMYQTAHVSYLPAAGSPYPGEKFFDIDWTQGGLVNETPNLLEVVDNTTFSMNGSGLALFNFGLSFSVTDTSASIDLIVECIRLPASGTETVLKVSTMAIRGERLNDDVFSLTVLAPIAEDDRVRLRVRTADTINVNLGCSASVSCTILPSITNTVELQPFEAATATSDGKAGLVPAPEATPDNELLNRFLSAKGGWSGIDLCALHPTAQSAELNKVLLDMGGVSGEGVNIDTLLRSGFFTANAFAGTLPDGIAGGVLINIMSIGADGLYYGQQILISYINYRLYFRGNILGIQPGGTANWYPWSCLTPIPQAAAGVGQWRELSTLGGAGGQITVPSGGAWAYFLTGVNSINSVPDGTITGIAAGGTVLTVVSGSGAPLSNVWGFCWRIA